MKIQPARVILIKFTIRHLKKNNITYISRFIILLLIKSKIMIGSDLSSIYNDHLKNSFKRVKFNTVKF